MELLKLPKNLALYEKHKAQARERTRRYRAKRREQQQMNLENNQSLYENLLNVPRSNVHARHPISSASFPFLQLAEVKLEETSDDDVTIVT